MSLSGLVTEKKKSQAVWGATPAGSSHALGLEPGTKEFFLQSYRAREEEMSFLKELIPFASFGGKRVLEIGNGVGYDAYDFCSHGAVYTGVDITPENAERCRNHLRHFGMAPMVVVGDAESLPLNNISVDAVFSNGVLHHTPDIEQSFREAHRVLKTKGEFWVILYNRNSIFHWISVVLVGYLLSFNFLRRSYREQLSMIEYTTSNVRPLVKVFTKNNVQTLLESASFRVDQLWVRRLTRDDFPNLPLLRQIWKFLPARLLEWMGARWGWYIIAKATKLN